MSHPREERTLVLVKPDGVKRGLTGEVIRRIEQRGLKIVAIQLIKPPTKQLDDHYPKDAKWIRRLGEKTLMTYEKYGYDPMKELKTSDPAEIGKQVRSWLIDFMTSGPIIKMVVEGVHAVDMLRKMTGATVPALADMGTIRGDFSVDSAASANRDKRAIFNIIHASEVPEEAVKEIKHWFTPEEIHSYERTDDSVF
jgi:nucleoside-diphosphate kinase